MENDASSKSLFQCFVEGKRCLQKLEDIAALDPHYEPTLRKGIEHLRAAMQMINKFGLFSANEEAEDIKTASLKYDLELRSQRRLFLPTNDVIFLLRICTSFINYIIM
jgi:hypothetical protein